MKESGILLSLSRSLLFLSFVGLLCCFLVVVVVIVVFVVAFNDRF